MIRRAGSIRAGAWLSVLGATLVVGIAVLARIPRTPTAPIRVAEDRSPLGLPPASSEAVPALEMSGSGPGQRTLAGTAMATSGPEVSGIERIVRGLVVDDAEVPVPDVEVEAGLERAGRRERLAGGSSTQDGRFEIRVSFDPTAFVQKDSRLYARLCRDGFQKDVDSTRLLREGLEAELKLKLKLKRGATLSGRVLGPDGHAVRIAQLELWEPAGDRKTVAESTWAHRGLFDLHYERGGQFELRVRAKGVGVAKLENVQLDLTRDPEPVTIRIRDRDYLAGVLRERSGKGIPNVALVAFPEERILDDDAKLRASDPGVEESFADHMWRIGVSTDMHGCFRFDGLEPSRYFIVAFIAGDGAPFDQDRTLYSTGDEHIALTRDFGLGGAGSIEGRLEHGIHVDRRHPPRDSPRGFH